MKKVGITYEIARRTYEEFNVSDEDYELIQKGDLPKEIVKDLEDKIESLQGVRFDDWAAEDCVTGKTIQDWRE